MKSTYTLSVFNPSEGVSQLRITGAEPKPLTPCSTTNSSTILDLAGRIESSQEDEINFMESWLKDRDEFQDNNLENHQMHHSHNMMHKHVNMVGMATPKQLDDLNKSKSTDFDRLFLQLMINHHDGALEMVEELIKIVRNFK